MKRIQYSYEQLQEMNAFFDRAIQEKKEGNFESALEIYIQSEFHYPGIDLNRSISKGKVLILLGRKSEAIDALISGIKYFSKYENEILNAGNDSIIGLAINAIEYYAFCLKQWLDEVEVINRLKGESSQSNLNKNNIERMKLGLIKLEKLGIWCGTFQRVKDNIIVS